MRKKHDWLVVFHQPRLKNMRTSKWESLTQKGMKTKDIRVATTQMMNNLNWPSHMERIVSQLPTTNFQLCYFQGGYLTQLLSYIYLRLGESCGNGALKNEPNTDQPTKYQTTQMKTCESTPQKPLAILWSEGES